MVEWRLKSKRKASGGIRKSRNRSDKKKAWLGRNAADTKISEKSQKEIHRTRGKTSKTKLRLAAEANVSDGKGKTFRAKVVNVLGNNANRQFARRQIITKGAVIEVEHSGKKSHAVVTGRPGQKGILQAKALEKPVEIEKKQEEPQKKVEKGKSAEKATEKPSETPPDGTQEAGTGKAVAAEPEIAPKA